MKFQLLNFAKKKKKTNLYLPDPLYPDDVFLASYPKSGNTWVRFLIANLIKQKEEEIIDFNTIQEIIPEVVRNEEAIRTLARPRIIKSHATHTEYPKVIYIVRDGRDVYVSYYFYRQNKLGNNISFKDFLKRRDHYPCLWGEHVNSWLFSKNKSTNILVVKYEDLIINCLEQLKRIVNFIGLEATEKQLQSSVEASNFENMRRLEVERGRPYQTKERVEVFVRKGKPGNWRDFFGLEEKAIFNSREGKFLIKLGYEIDNNW